MEEVSLHDNLPDTKKVSDGFNERRGKSQSLIICLPLSLETVQYTFNTKQVTDKLIEILTNTNPQEKAFKPKVRILSIHGSGMLFGISTKY